MLNGSTSDESNDATQKNYIQLFCVRSFAYRKRRPSRWIESRDLGGGDKAEVRLAFQDLRGGDDDDGDGVRMQHLDCASTRSKKNGSCQM